MTEDMDGDLSGRGALLTVARESERARRELLAAVFPARQVVEQFRDALGPTAGIRSAFQAFAAERQSWIEQARSTWSAIESAASERAMLRRASASEELAKIREQATEATRAFQRSAKRSAFQEFAAELYRERLEDLLAPGRKHLQEVLRRLPARMRDALLRLAQHGWFLDGEMAIPELWDLEDALLNRSSEEAESKLVDYFRSRVAQIQGVITTRFPKREKPLQAAFAAHNRGEYELSIPVLLAQADGICKEVVKKALFQTRKGRPQIAEIADGIEAETIAAALLHPLTQPLPISASGASRGSGFKGLNRHAVLHGEASDYGTEANSLCAISLLNYVVHVCDNAAQE